VAPFYSLLGTTIKRCPCTLVSVPLWNFKDGGSMDNGYPDKAGF
jgi:hypothetical protein